jgi:hypothetical protein
MAYVKRCDECGGKVDAYGCTVDAAHQHGVDDWDEVES